jgi:hypothetical protein
VGAAFGNQWLTRAVAQLASSADGDRALAVETLELELGRRTAARLLELVDPDVDDDGRRALLAAAVPSDGRAADPWVNELLDDPQTYWQDDWLRACALYAASELAPESAAAAALTWQDAADPVLAETARWLRGELDRPRRLESSSRAATNPGEQGSLWCVRNRTRRRLVMHLEMRSGFACPCICLLNTHLWQARRRPAAMPPESAGQRAGCRQAVYQRQ